jgi:hypothetical protein
MKATAALLVLASAPAFGADSQWVLERSTLTYHVSHPLHQSEGVSHAARGKAVCHAGECALLVAVPVKSFESGDSNRDLHMIQVVRGAEFPIVTVRFRLPEDSASLPIIHADLDVQFDRSRWRRRGGPRPPDIPETRHALAGARSLEQAGFIGILRDPCRRLARCRNRAAASRETSRPAIAGHPEDATTTACPL